MKALLDENLPVVLVSALGRHGFEVRHVSDFAPGTADVDVLSAADGAAEILVTADKDFGELVWRHQKDFHGVVLVRAHPVGDHVDRVADLMALHRHDLPNAFVVISADRIRIRQRRAPSDS